MLHSERRIQSGLGQGWLRAHWMIILKQSDFGLEWSMGNKCNNRRKFAGNSLFLPWDQLCADFMMARSWVVGQPLSSLLAICHMQSFYGYSFIKTGNSNKLYEIHVVNPLKNTTLNINKTRIRRKIYPYRKCWKYPWRKCDCQGKCDIYWPCSKLNNSTEK